MIKEAFLYRHEEKNRVTCILCNHRCSIAPDKFGICKVRQNREGKLFTHVYGEVIAAHVDPIEKKPLFHFFPGSRAFSIATRGCNFQCPFCQNWQISQVSSEETKGWRGRDYTPGEIVRAAKRNGCLSISYTYTEPTIYFEFAYDTARLAKKDGLYNNFVTNGYMTAEALEMIQPYLDACNVDLKSFSDGFYKRLCKARLEPVLDSIRLMKRLGIFVEITTLVVPGQNDSDEELTQIARFISCVDPKIPWHISRYHPDFKFDSAPPTPIQTLRKAYEIGKGQGLSYIYIGNVAGESEDTFCPRCGKSLIKRRGYEVSTYRLKIDSCSFCGFRISGVFREE